MLQIKIPETYLLATYESARLSFYQKQFERDFKDKRTGCGLIPDEHRNELYNYYCKQVDIKTLQNLNKIKTKDPIYKEFNKKYLKNNMGLRMKIIKIEKNIVSYFYDENSNHSEFMNYLYFKDVFENMLFDAMKAEGVL